MIVISDTSALSTLIQIGELDILKHLFTEIVIPDTVFNELLILPQLGVDVSALTNSNWIVIKKTPASPTFSLLKSMLDEGEASAISLAVDLKADLLIIDEKKGRKIAQSMNIQITGLGGVLIQAKQAGLITDVKSFLDMIGQKTNFYLSQKARALILQAAGEQP
jgi:uncharacterized protein